MLNFFGDNFKYITERVNRIIVDNNDGSFSAGSGFFIQGTNKFLTCLHVLSGKKLSELRIDQVFIKTTGPTEHERLLSFLNTKVKQMTVQLLDGTQMKVSLKDFDEKYDIAIVELESTNERLPKGFKIDFKPSLQYGNEVSFCGYQYVPDYNAKQYPLAVNKGIVSAFLEIMICGEKYEHLQINSINLGGNSGAPLFKRRGRKVIGIINGNMNWGNDNVMIKDLTDNQVKPNSFRVPLSIAYATPINVLKDNTRIFD